MWLNGSKESKRYSGFAGNARATPSTLARMLPCVSTTPLGSPVVPDVNMISAMLSLVRVTGAGEDPTGGRLVTISSRRTNGTVAAGGASIGPAISARAGSVWPKTCAWKSGPLRMSSGTTIAPQRSAPKKAATHQGLLGAHRTTRCPGATPRACSQRATRPDSSRSRLYVQTSVL
jgi:hypothetical protein